MGLAFAEGPPPLIPPHKGEGVDCETIEAYQSTSLPIVGRVGVGVAFCAGLPREAVEIDRGVALLDPVRSTRFWRQADIGA